MERKVLFEASVSRPGAATMVGVVGGLAVIPVVALGLNLYIGDDQLPRELHGSTPWFAVASVVLGAIAGFLWWRSRRKLALVEVAGRQVLEIDDQPPVLVQGPFTISTGWTRLPQPRGPAMTLLQVVFRDGDRVPLVMTETWGAIYGQPGWPEGLHAVEAEASYTPAGRAMLTRLVDALDRT